MEISEIDLEVALGAGQVEICFQPVANLHGLRVVGVEALARLRDQGGKVRLPIDFVPAAEKIGLARALTDHVVARAIEDFTRSISSASALWLSLNLPLEVFVLADAPAMVADHARRCRLSAPRVLIELTESQPVQDLRQAGEAIARWRDRGFGIVLDDIDPDTNNLRQLLDLPFCGVKLDLMVVRRLKRDPAAVRFVDEIVAHAAKRGMTVVAEGVESEATAARSRSLGVDHAQGFLISRPVSSDMLPAWW